MPELPEVETMVRGIRPAVEGRRIEEMLPVPCSCRPIALRPGMKHFSREVSGLKIKRVFRRAKRCVMELESGSGIVIEPRMTGLMLLADPPDRGHLRIEWRLERKGFRDKAGSLWFWDRRGLGTVSLLNSRELAELLEGPQLGPDALIASCNYWEAICSRTSRPIKILMLDQKAVAGIGNLYASEILHRAAIHPETPAKTLTIPQISRIAEMTKAILEEAILYEGSTLSDGTYRNALNLSGSYQNAHRVYDREQETCTTCRKGNILRIVQGQRSTFFCPGCQKPNRIRK